jgi:hypothetical protein
MMATDFDANARKCIADSERRRSHTDPSRLKSPHPACGEKGTLTCRLFAMVVRREFSGGLNANV